MSVIASGNNERFISLINEKIVLDCPGFRCVSVNQTGDVTLSWVPPADPSNTFNSYHIFSSTNINGPYTEIDSIFNYHITSYTHVGANANNHTLYYFLETRSDSSISLPSDTLQTIYLSVVNSMTGTAELIWNPIHDPDLSTSTGWYHIYREYPTGIWNLIDSTQLLKYSDTVNFCNTLLNYYVGISDESGCISTSNIDGDLFQDINAPSTPNIDSVSVNPASGNSVIGWNASPSGDTEGYIIYENENGIWVPIDTVMGGTVTYYENNLPNWSDPSSSSLSYSVASFDSCKNTSPISNFQNTILLSNRLDICGGEISLNWSSYINMPNNVNGYKIYVKENNGSFTLAGINSSSTSSFIYSPINPFSVYVFYVQAFNSDNTITSSSNPDTVFAYSPDLPQFVYLQHASVKNNSYVELKILIDTSGYTSNCKILRADSTGIYNEIGNVSPSSNSNIILYNDMTAMVNEQSYCYKVILTDSCGNELMESNPGCTILLSAIAEKNMINTLTWNEYSEWLGNVSEYNIYRSVNDVWGTNPIATLSPGTTSYSEDVSSYISSNGNFKYYIEALEGTGNPYLCTDSSFSNVAEATQPPLFFIPNAFAPNGYNKIFIPQTVFVDAQDYQFTVYNRWGQIVFETTDLHTGWDGTFEGELLPLGVYVYHFQYKNSEGNTIEKRGTVTLIR